MTNGAFASFGRAPPPTKSRSPIIIDRKGNKTKKLPNVHPGEVLLEEFLEPMGISQNRLARAIGVPPRRVNEIVLGKRSITPDTALRLSRFFGTSSRFWLGLQMDYDLEETERAEAARINREVRPREQVGVW